MGSLPSKLFHIVVNIADAFTVLYQDVEEIATLDLSL